MTFKEGVMIFKHKFQGMKRTIKILDSDETIMDGDYASSVFFYEKGTECDIKQIKKLLDYKKYFPSLAIGEKVSDHENHTDVLSYLKQNRIYFRVLPFGHNES